LLNKIWSKFVDKYNCVWRNADWSASWHISTKSYQWQWKCGWDQVFAEFILKYLNDLLIISYSLYDAQAFPFHAFPRVAAAFCICNARYWVMQQLKGWTNYFSENVPVVCQRQRPVHFLYNHIRDSANKSTYDFDDLLVNSKLNSIIRWLSKYASIFIYGALNDWRWII